MGKAENEATGKKLGIPGEDLPGVTAAHDFLKAAGAKLHYRVKGDVVVIGCGSTAVECARTAMRAEADSVTIVCAEKGDEMTAAPEEIAAAKDEGVRLIRGWMPTSMDAHSDGKVCGVHFKHCDQLYDSTGKYAPLFDVTNTMGRYADIIIVALD